jgi:hypothetical protein
VAKIGSNGRPLVGSKVKAFAYEHSVGYARTWTGWFDYAISCDCKVDDTTGQRVFTSTRCEPYSKDITEQRQRFQHRPSSQAFPLLGTT